MGGDKERLRLLAQASRLLAATSIELDAALEALARIFVPRLADDCIVFIIEPDGTPRRVTEASVHPRHAELLRGLRKRPPVIDAANEVATAVRSGRTVHVAHVDDRALANLAATTDHAAALREIAPTTFISVPLIGRGQVLGAVTLGMSSSRRTYAPEDIALAEELGRLAGMTIDNARLFRNAVDERARAERAELRTARLQATTAALGRVMTPGEAGAAVLEQGLGVFGAADGGVFVIEHERVRALAMLRTVPDVDFPLEAELPVAWSARTGRHLFLEDRRALLEQFPHVEPHATDTVQSAIVLALSVKGVVLGAIGMSFTEPRTFSPEERQFAESIAAQCALAIDRALLMQRERAAAARSAFLGAASELLASSLDPERVLEELVQLVVPRLADWCAVEMIEGESTRQLAVAHVDPEKVKWAAQLRDKYPPDRASPRGLYEVLRTGKPEIYPMIPAELLEAAAVDAEHLALIRQLQMRSAIIVPLLTSGRPIGAMTLVWAESGNHYTPSDLELFTELAHRAALAVENARLYRDLRQAVQVRDDFLAAAGHELKTPLAALLMQLNSLQRLILRDAAPANLGQRLDKAASAGSRLERLIDELLDVSRITAGRLRLEAEPMHLDELVRDVVDRFAEQAASAGCSIALRTIPVHGTWDRLRIDQVVSNLVANALKYGTGAPIEIDLSAHGPDAILAVTDHGIGIAVEEQAKIFERFERAVENRDFGGFGLGLWIARQIVEASHGTIEVTSAPAEGARFVVRLPLASEVRDG